MSERNARPSSADRRQRSATRQRARRVDRTFTPPSVTTAHGSAPADGLNLTLAAALGALLGLRRLSFLALDDEDEDEDDGLHFAQRLLQPVPSEEAIRVLPARDRAEAARVVAARRDGQDWQTSFLEAAPGEESRPTDTLVGLVSATPGPLTAEARGEAGVLVWGVTEREAAAARRLLADEAGVQASLAGAAGFAALVRALLTDRQAPVRARRLPPGLMDAIVAVHT